MDFFLLEMCKDVHAMYLMRNKTFLHSRPTLYVCMIVAY